MKLAPGLYISFFNRWNRALACDTTWSPFTSERQTDTLPQTIRSKDLIDNMNHNMTKPTKWLCAQRRLRSAWASAQSDQSSLSAWRKLGSLATHWAHSEDSDLTGWMPRLIWVFAGWTRILLVLSWCGSYHVIYSCWTLFKLIIIHNMH